MPFLRKPVGRNFYRWYFYPPDQAMPLQTKGIAVRLRKTGWFGGLVGSAVVKDMSIGGAGVLVSVQDQVPTQLWVLYDERIKVRAMVRYRRQVNEKLEFLGLEWQGRNYPQRLALLRKLRRQAFDIRQPHFRPPATVQRQLTAIPAKR